MKDYVYFVGVGQLGLGALATAKRLGLGIIGTDRNENAPGFAHCDESFVLDGTDARAHSELATRLAGKKRVIGVYCGAEFGLESARRVAGAFGVAANDEAALARSLDKRALKETWLAAGLPTPWSETVSTAAELSELLSEYAQTERLVLKPTAGSGSRGVHVVPPDVDAKVAIAKCMDAVGGAGAVLVEPFLEGRSIDANGLLLNGRFLGCGVLEKFTTPLPDRLPIGGCDPPDLTSDEVAEVYELLERGARALGLSEGPLKADLIRTPTGFQLLEVAPRFHGDVTTQNTLPYGTGLDPLAYLLRSWQSGAPLAEAELHRPRTDVGGHALWRVIALPPGKVHAWPEPTSSSLRARHPNVTQVWHNPRCDERIARYADTTSVPGYACAFGRTPQEAEAALAAWFADAEYAVESDPGDHAWYRALGDELDRLGFDRRASGWQSASRPRAMASKRSA